MSSSARSVLAPHRFDAKVCRRLVSTSCTYQGVRPATALDVIRWNSGVTNRAIVVGVGYNDGSVGGAIDAIVAEARRQGVPHVVWLTYRQAGSNAGIYRSHNATVRAKAAVYPELHVADWASLSAGRGDWVAADGLHLNGSGARAMAALIDGVLSGIAPPGPPPIEPGGRACFVAGGPAGDAGLFNITPVSARGPGHGVLARSGTSPPADSSNVNFGVGTVDPNVAVAPIGTDGRVCFHNSVHADVHVVVDHLGTFAGSVFAPARPDGLAARRIDTRLRGVAVPAGGHSCFEVSGSPGDGAVVNLTPVGATAAGHGVLTSGAEAAPDDASNVNYTPTSVDPNIAIAPIGPDGTVCFHASTHASVHIVADQLGAISADVFDPASADGVPSRRIDTRLDGVAVAPGGRRCFATGGKPGGAAILNLTPVQATAAGHGLLVSSDAVAPSDASNVNFRPRSVDPNVAVVRIGDDGRACFAASTHASVHIVADLLGTLDAAVFTTPTGDGRPARRIDTRID